MKLRNLFLAGVAAVALAGPAAADAPQGWYVGVGAGWDDPTGVNGPGGSNLNTDDTIAVLGAIGYRWSSGWRAEVETNYADPDYNFFGIKGDAEQWAAMGNLAYDIPLQGNWALTLGGGAGWAWVSPGNGLGSDSAFAWQGIAGFSWMVTPKMALQLDYRYFSIGNTTHSGFGVSHDDSNRVMLSLRFHLQHD